MDVLVLPQAWRGDTQCISSMYISVGLLKNAYHERKEFFSIPRLLGTMNWE